MNGYKISNSHFKLGSKTHIKDFIYAKRLFQNSYYAHRFAFIVAKYLKNYFANNPIGDKSLTLLGYGEYSQMLINRVERLIKPIIPNINHDMVRDIETPELIKGEPLNDYIIIIVPISTTFSTSIKVDNMVQQMNKQQAKKSIILEPFINLILVSHNDISKQDYVEGLNTYLAREDLIIDEKYHPYKLFNWSYVDFNLKLVSIITNATPNVQKTQKFFISIPSEWYLMENCELCIPIQNILKEIPLLETDKASVTPELLLELPDAFKNNSYSVNKDIILNSDACTNHHIEHLGKHYLHYIKPLEFYKKYEEDIINWAKERNEDLKKWPELFQSRVLIISPSHQSNTYFVELVNRYVFYDSATIIHYEVLGDFVENYQKFFGDIIKSADFIFYIDDFIESGDTFRQINDFVKLCKRLNKNLVSPDGCDGLFTLINKTDYYSYTDILSQLNKRKLKDITESEKYFSFYDLKINSVTKENCPLCQEQKRYSQLAEHSMLDTIRHYFLSKKIKLNTKGIMHQENSEETDWGKFHPLVDETVDLPWEDKTNLSTNEKWSGYAEKKFPERKYLLIMIQHELNYLLSTNAAIRLKLKHITEIANSEFEKSLTVINELFAEINGLIFNSPSLIKIRAEINRTNQVILQEHCQHMILKIFTMYPLVNVKVIKQVIFSKILMEIDSLMNTILNQENLKFKDFRFFKFLLKRATLMGSNYLIRKETLLNLRKIYRKYTPEKKDKIEGIREKRIKYFEEKEKIYKEQISLYNTEIDLANNNIGELQRSFLIEKATDNQTLPFELAGILNELKETVKSFISFVNDCKSQLAYIKQAKINIAYKEASLSEFSYFYVALIKELTINNDPKVLILEDNIRELKHNLDPELDEDFMFLIRLIQFENTNVIHQGVKLIVDDYLSPILEIDGSVNKLITFDKKCSDNEIHKKINEQIEIALKNYQLASFKKFLQIEDFATWSQTQEYLVYVHVLYLITALKNEESSPSSFGLEDKTKAIIQNLYRIVAYPDFKKDTVEYDSSIQREIYEYKGDNINLGGFFSVRYKAYKKEQVNPDQIFIAQATSKHTNTTGPSLLKVEIDTESISYILINGVSSRLPTTLKIEEKDGHLYKNYHTKPRTILELRLDDNNGHKFWKVNKGKLFPLYEYLKTDLKSILIDPTNEHIKYGFTENLDIKGEPTQMLFFRVADIYENNGTIKNIGQAVIGLFNQEKSFDVERIRLLLLSRSYILSFMKTHFDTDSLTALIREKVKLKEAEKLKHGYLYYLNGLRSLASGETKFDDPDEQKDFSKLYFDLIKSGPLLYSTFSEIDDMKLKNKAVDQEFWESKEMPLQNFTATQLTDKFMKISKMILETINLASGGLSAPSEFKTNVKYIVKNSEIAGKVISFPETLIDIIFAELVINAKKNFPKENPELYFEIHFSDLNEFKICILNNFTYNFTPKLWMRINKNNVKYNTNGLGLIKRITGLLCDVYADVREADYGKYNKQLFQVSLILKSI